MKNPSVPNNPIVESLLKKGDEEIVEVAGYPGPCEKGLVRIYRDLSLESYIEIPQDAVLHFVEADPQDQCKIFFKGTASIIYVTKTQVSPTTLMTRSITVPASEVKRTDRGRTLPSTLASNCINSVSKTKNFKQRKGDGSDFPPTRCEFMCDHRLSKCLYHSIHWFWCLMAHFDCRTMCAYGPWDPWDMVVHGYTDNGLE